MDSPESALFKRILTSVGDDETHPLHGYSYERVLPSGGMGVVAVVRSASGVPAALKVMRPDLPRANESKPLFEREIANLMSLDHPHVVRFFGAGVASNTPFFLMEYCAGGSVAQLIELRGGKLPIGEAIDIALQSLAGLDYAHNASIPFVTLADGRVVEGKGLVHRDIKPGNLFLMHADGPLLVKVGDYGLSKAFEFAGLSGYTMLGAIGGTLPFMCRQQAINYLHARPEVDVWAVAASLYYMITAQVPRDFLTTNPLNAILHTAPVPIRNRDPSVPSALADLIDFALDDRGDLHFSSAESFKHALEEVRAS